MEMNFSGKQDVYVEIAMRIEEHIRLGIYKLGDKLPSVRVEAGSLGVNPNTVARAYSYLEEKGFIRALPKKGAYVIFDKTQENVGNKAENEQLVRAKELVFSLKELGLTFDEVNGLVKEVFEDDQH